jgi:hypothetical protein
MLKVIWLIVALVGVYLAAEKVRFGHYAGLGFVLAIVGCIGFLGFLGGNRKVLMKRDKDAPHAPR